ncbi:fungal-specific transcription factor domain-containing protein [Dendryphion nanum]|uniref:Fungal-specific transcription factor domain-containing protein n=1 Tax=Dendryphion nanum TaxID=256645 RepID=A0A9P9IU26_9PLEO|nr:fungal-specific transcription factor domain-containing protein [Dendryphion nanum]
MSGPPTTTTNANSRRVPLDKRKRTETSCDKCKSRKQKCRKEPGQDSCRYCILHKIECQTTQPRKKRLYGSVEGLGNRLALLESLVKGLLPEADISSLDDMRRVGSSLGILLPDAGNGDTNADYRSSSSTETEDPLSLLPDQQGQVQYIGPSSSFSFYVKLRTLVGQGAIREFVLFGRNAADQEPIDGDTDPHSLSTPGAASSVDQSSPGDCRSSVNEMPSLELLISAFFEHIDPDFPVLHEASFREAYEQWIINPAKADPAWLCSLLCVLLLARRVTRMSFPEDQERLWWKRVQTLLPVVIFTSSLTAVQALMLAAIHLHNTNHRDACWNLTGTAIRIAYAIGLHQDKVSTLQTPLARELRKRLWWTLYAFEQMQVSSYDRPSAIEHAGSRIGCANERIIGMAGYCPPDYSKWFNKLVVHLGSACRAPKTAKSSASEESYVGPLSPAAGVLRDLDRWKESLPTHLKLDAVETSPPAFQRPLLLLHAKYHYIVLVLCRAALLSRATILSKEGKDSSNAALTGMADSCVASGQSLSQIILHLESLGKFDAITWWDVWYTLACGSILVLDIVCTTKRGEEGLSESRILLSQMADLAQQHRRNPHMPGTIEKWASLVPELHSMADTINAQVSPTPVMPKIEPPIEPKLSRQHFPPHQEPMTYPFHHSATSSGAYMFADNTPGRFYPEADIQNGTNTNFGSRTYDRNAQTSFMDFTINNIQDWNWGDLGSLLGNEGVPPHSGG